MSNDTSPILTVVFINVYSPVCPMKFNSPEKEQTFDTGSEMSEPHNRVNEDAADLMIENKMRCTFATISATFHCTPSALSYVPVSFIKRRIRGTFGK